MAVSKVDAANQIENQLPQANIAGNVNFRNILINGDMSIAQRGTSISVSASSITYGLDRFLTRGNSNTAHTVVQSTDAPDGFKNSLYLTRDSGQTGSLIRLQQPVETNNIFYLRGQKVTLSFYAKKDTGATDSDLSINLYTGDGTERARAITAYDNEVNAISGTATLTESWQRFTFTSSTLISDLSQLSIEINYNGVGTAPSNDGYYITGVQLEAGTTASDFEFLPVDVNLQRCQRYFERTTSVGANGAFANFGTGVVFNSSFTNTCFLWKTKKRANPTMSSSAANTFLNENGGSFPAGTAISLSQINKTSCQINLDSASGLTTGNGNILKSNNNNTSFIDADAEL